MKHVLSFDIGIKNLAYCLMNIDNWEILEWDIKDISNGGKDNNVDTLADNIIEFLDDLLLRNDSVAQLDILIENQPVLKAPKMKTIQLIIYSYFKIMNNHGMRESKPMFVSAGKKNTYMKSNGYTLIPKNYKSNKETSIKMITDYLRNIKKEKELEKLNSYKKKDDIADSLIQILAFYNCVIII